MRTIHQDFVNEIDGFACVQWHVRLTVKFGHEEIFSWFPDPIYSFPFRYKCIIVILFDVSFFFFFNRVLLSRKRSLVCTFEIAGPYKSVLTAAALQDSRFWTAKQPIRWRDFTESSSSHKMCILSG